MDNWLIDDFINTLTLSIINYTIINFNAGTYYTWKQLCDTGI
jgi:F0F1-type ATP synthase assembly protein I